MNDNHHHYLTEHIWRAIRAFLLLLAVSIWILQDGFQFTDVIVVVLCFLAHLTEQFHGRVCNMIEGMLGWRKDFNDWN